MKYFKIIFSSILLSICFCIVSFASTYTTKANYNKWSEIYECDLPTYLFINSNGKFKYSLNVSDSPFQIRVSHSDGSGGGIYDAQKYSKGNGEYYDFYYKQFAPYRDNQTIGDGCIELKKDDGSDWSDNDVHNYIVANYAKLIDDANKQSENNGTHSADIGTLQNISYKDIILDDGKMQASNIQYHRFSFNQKSSTGIDIKDERYSIQYMLVSTLMRKRGILSKDLTQSQNYGERSRICTDDSHNLYIEYSHEEMFNLLPDSLNEYRSMNFLYKDKLTYDTYLRIFDNETNSYGTWVRVRVKGGEITDLLNGDLDTENTEVEFLDDDGNIISGGSTENGFSASEGQGHINEGSTTHGNGSINTGYSKEEALQNAENGKTFLIGFGDSKEYVQNVTSLFSEILSALGNVPKIIGDVFTFLPSWIVSFISFSIGVTLIIGLIKTLWS